MEHTRKQYTISVYTENNIGLLNRISAIFQRRHINIESMNISVSEIEAVSRFTILVNMTEVNVRKIIGQIEKQIEVIKAFYHTDEETIYLESCMFKIKSELLSMVPSPENKFETFDYDTKLEQYKVLNSEEELCDQKDYDNDYHYQLY